MKKLPPLNWLRAFEASARHLSFSKAADELNVTQSAISQHIKLLEHFLKHDLFIRSHRQLKLTDRGKYYLPIVSQSFSMLEIGTDEFFGAGKNLVYCFCDISFSNCFIAPRLHEFKKAYPEIEVRIQNSVWWQRRQQQEIPNHIEIRFGLGDWPEASEKLGNSRFYPVVSAKHNIPVEITLDNIKDIPLYQLMGVRYNWQQWLKEAGVKDKIHFAIQTDSTANNLELVRQGHGMALMQNILASAFIKDKVLKKPFELELVAKDGFYLIGDKKNLSKSERCFTDWLLDVSRFA